MDQVTLVKNQMRARNWQEFSVPVEAPGKPVVFKQLEVYIACGYTDMRKSIDSLAVLVKQRLQKFLT